MSWLEILRTNGKEFHQFFQDELKLIIVTMLTRIDSSVRCEDFRDNGPGDHAQGMRNWRIILPPKANKVPHVSVGCTTECKGHVGTR